MSEAVKTRPIEQPVKRKANLLYFRLSTPRKILLDAKKRYAPYLDTEDSESVPIANTLWYKQMSKEMTPAKYLKTYREIAGYSQARLGSLAGISASRISDYETEQRSISKDIAKKLAEIFNVSPAVFI